MEELPNVPSRLQLRLYAIECYTRTPRATWARPWRCPLDREYHDYRDALRGQQFPCAYVDLDKFDQNLRDILDRAHSMPICVATKSLRAVAILQRIQAASPQFHSFMAYSVREAVFLTEHGLDNILVAYPVWGEARFPGLAQALRDGKTITLMIDSAEHLDHLEAIAAAANVVIPCCIDLDMSTSFPGLHFGVRRSGVKTPEQAVGLWRLAERCAHLRLDGLMGYEAQIAGLQDKSASRLKSAVIPWLKQRSLREVRTRRRKVVEALQAAGCALRFVNGGGTGSVETTIAEEVVTEVTVGSGFYAPVLFDGYNRFKHLPAAGFAIEIVRQPTDTIYTCHGGGYIASGPPGPDRLPQPFLPQGAALLPLEGAGEVQTPIEYRGSETLSLGDPVFLRHAKAGELCERFKSLLLIEGGKVVDEVPTYRGEGACFV